MLRAFLLVGIGGFLGSIARYAISLTANKYELNTFPFATLIINIIGCFLIGLFFGMSQRSNIFSTDSWLVLATGFCGGFTTFSAFALENVNLFGKGQNLTGLLYIVTSVTGGILVCKLGLWLTGS